MNILLTGSGGFIGKNLKSFLKNEYTLLTPRSFELDLRDSCAVLSYFKNNDIDFIIHCGTTGGLRGVQDEETTVIDNILMVDNLIQAKKKDTRIILFGSGAMYGKSRPLKKVKEEEIGNFTPLDLYGQSKMLIAQKALKRSDILCLNIFACYGYWERDIRFPTYAISQNLKHEAIEINQNVIFDYLFVEDMQKIVAYFIKNKPKDNIINITPTDSISLVEISNIINQISDFKSEIILKNQTLNNEYTGSNNRLLKNYPNFKFTDYKEGLTKLYNFIAHHNI